MLALFRDDTCILNSKRTKSAYILYKSIFFTYLLIVYFFCIHFCILSILVILVY